mmetsp:Transcript_36597/g.67067  ORF Transcript_36597/g.67067 Transcript_36597/m.67067 type:complete len:253 (+) Transcript_36597:59-817(+)
MLERKALIKPGNRVGGTDVHQVVFYSVLAGLAALAPVPCMDDAVETYASRAMIIAQLRNFGMEPTVSQVSKLRWRPHWWLKLVRKVFYYLCCCWLLEFCFKKCCYVLSMRDAVLNTSELFHEGWLLTYALKKGYINQGNLSDSGSVRQVREAILDTVDEVDTSPITSSLRVIYKEKWGLLQGASEVLYSNLSSAGVQPGPTVGDDVEEALGATEADERQELGSTVSQVEQMIESHRPYLSQLEAVFEANYRG